MSHVRRAMESSALGLGWLLALSVGGAVLLFTAVGFLLTWRMRSRSRAREQAEENERAVGQVSDTTDDHHQAKLTKRLTKRKEVTTESTNRFSLTLPPVLPPLPTYHSLGFPKEAKKGRSSAWVEEDKFHGPKVSKSLRDSWFGRDSWMNKTPTLPVLIMDDQEKGEARKSREQTENAQKRMSREKLKHNKTDPELPLDVTEETKTSPIKAPRQAYVRASVTDSDLRYILRSTEERLRDGQSQSPTKTPQISSQKYASLRGSPVNIPRSHKTSASLDSTQTTGTVRISRMTPSPSKRATIHTVPSTAAHSGRKASISSIGSAADSLIAEATQELVLPGGLSSPSRMKACKRETEEDDEMQRPVLESRKSTESNASSSLSTLYSANDPEEKKTEQSDPFVERRASGAPPSNARSTLFGPRGVTRRTRTLSISLPSGQSVFNAPPATQEQGYLKPTSVSTQAFGGPPIMLQPPSFDVRNGNYNNRDRDEGIALAFPVSNSYTSMLTPSVTTATDDDTMEPPDERRSESPQLMWQQSDQVDSTPQPKRMQPNKRDSQVTIGGASPSTTMDSSPFDEQDMLSLLMTNPVPSRALPDLPRHISYADQTARSLSPRPTKDFSQQLRQMSIASSKSSIYDEESIVEGPGAISTGSPTRRSIIRMVKESPVLPPPPPPPPIATESLGNSIVELRRMNSMISSYSATSMASSRFGDPDSPTLPPLCGTLSPISARNAGNSGRQNYLNLGSSPSSKKATTTPGRQLPPSRSQLSIEITEEDSKENQNPDPETTPPVPARGDVGLRETRRRGNLGRDTRDSLLTTRAGSKTRLGTVSETKRESVEASSPYGKNGFLKSSPDVTLKGAKGRCLRM